MHQYSIFNRERGVVIQSLHGLTYDFHRVKIQLLDGFHKA